MANLILFKKAESYANIKQAFSKVIEEFLPTLTSSYLSEAYAWQSYLKYFTEHKGPYITNRVANVHIKDIGTYLELIALPQTAQFHLYDANERVQKYVRIHDDYLIKGILIVPNEDSSNSVENNVIIEEKIATYVKEFLDKK